MPVLLILPVFRIIMKRSYVHIASHEADIVPEHVVFTVDFFDALYLASFLPGVSATSMVAVMAVDVVQTGIEFNEVRHRANSILTRLRMTMGVASDLNLPAACELLYYYLQTLEGQPKAGVRVRSCLLHQLTDDAKSLLEQLESKPSSGSIPIPSRIRAKVVVSPLPPTEFVMKQPIVFSVSQKLDGQRRKCSWKMQGQGRGSIAVFPSASTLTQTKLLDDTLNQSAENISNGLDVLPDFLELLFISEFLVLAEYLETIVPVIYGTFILGMTNLSSAQYHSDMVGITTANVINMVSRIFVYAMLEFLSFVMLATILKRNTGYSAMYHLAFVLETQMSFVMAKICIWMDIYPCVPH
ncbi:unnamed protein product [Phytophthora lilii]|uniref:Unnamed protein product n=1 Tax=Phytophthora lilii TaxID=2077276 RepID=A0A9W6TF98_9STRA|nr:unnamed protein product [Phytophthora lilii]